MLSNPEAPNTERDILYTFIKDDVDSNKAWHKIALFDTRAQRFVGTIAKSNTLRCRFDDRRLWDNCSCCCIST